MCEQDIIDDELLDVLCAYKGSNHPGKDHPLIHAPPERRLAAADLREVRIILSEGYTLLLKKYVPLTIGELMKHLKHGWGRCTKCGRLIAARKNGTAYRHGWRAKITQQACIGSGQPLNNWRQKSFWEDKSLL